MAQAAAAAAAQSAYRKVQPFDSNFLIDIISNENINTDDFKFVSWKDFDIALESDTELYAKLESLAKTERELSELTDKIEVNHFVPLNEVHGHGGSRYKEGNSIYYRGDRSVLAPGNANVVNAKSSNKERVEYQM